MLTLLAYIPVVHQGYLQLFAEYFAACETNGSTSKKLLLIPPELAAPFGPVHKEIRALDTGLIKKSIESWQLFDEVAITTKDTLQTMAANHTPLFMPDELITKGITAQYLPDCPTTMSSIFLRWDSENALKPKVVTPDQKLSEQEAFSNAAIESGMQSSDWWRQVGAVAVREGKIIAQAHNTHLPSPQQQYIDGDGRGQFKRGEQIDLSTSIHAEAKLVAEAAKSGLKLAGADLYVTDFPCPTCAKLIATVGFKRVFYQKEYSLFDGERVMRAAGIELIQVTD